MKHRRLIAFMVVVVIATISLTSIALAQGKNDYLCSTIEWCNDALNAALEGTTTGARWLTDRTREAGGAIYDAVDKMAADLLPSEWRDPIVNSPTSIPGFLVHVLEDIADEAERERNRRRALDKPRNKTYEKPTDKIVRVPREQSGPNENQPRQDKSKQCSSINDFGSASYWYCMGDTKAARQAVLDKVESYQNQQPPSNHQECQSKHSVSTAAYWRCMRGEESSERVSQLNDPYIDCACFRNYSGGKRKMLYELGKKRQSECRGPC